MGGYKGSPFEIRARTLWEAKGGHVEAKVYMPNFPPRDKGVLSEDPLLAHEAREYEVWVTVAKHIR